MTEHPWSSASLRLRELLEGLWRELDRQTGVTADGAMYTVGLQVSTPAGLLRLARDPDGLRHLLVPLGVGDRVDDDNRSAGVHLTTRTFTSDDALPMRYADIACRRQDVTAPFTGLVADLVGLIAAKPDQAPSLIVRTLQAWRLMLGGTAQRWTVPRLAGLFAELTVLAALLVVDRRAARTWLGPLGCPQDFRSDHHALEVKGTVASEGRVVHIHGADQLEAPKEGTLALAWLRIAESTAPAARSVPDLISRCREGTDDLIALDTRLAALGLPQDDDGPMATTRFLVPEQRWYEVAEDFPRIVPRSFGAGAVPTGVHDLEYRIDLDTVPHIIERDAVLERLGTDL